MAKKTKKLKTFIVDEVHLMTLLCVRVCRNSLSGKFQWRWYNSPADGFYVSDGYEYKSYNSAKSAFLKYLFGYGD